MTPYKSQVRAIKDKLFKLLRQSFDIDRPLDYIEVNTVDGYQGREKDIIIFSCVRSNTDKLLGFTADYRRMNVAITRARHCLFLFGNGNTLSGDRNWTGLLDYCKKLGGSHYQVMDRPNEVIKKSQK